MIQHRQHTHHNRLGFIVKQQGHRFVATQVSGIPLRQGEAFAFNGASYVVVSAIEKPTEKREKKHFEIVGRAR